MARKTQKERRIDIYKLDSKSEVEIYLRKVHISIDLSHDEKEELLMLCECIIRGIDIEQNKFVESSDISDFDNG